MYRHTSDVVQEDLRSLAAEIDPTAPGYASHLNFDQILRRCGHAWIAFLGSLDGLLGTGMIVPRVEVDYHREVDLGALEIDVVVLTLGRTSFRLGLTVRQAGEVATTVEVVLVMFDYAGRTPQLLTESQRAALEAHQVREPPVREAGRT